MRLHLHIAEYFQHLPRPHVPHLHVGGHHEVRRILTLSLLAILSLLALALVVAMGIGKVSWVPPPGWTAGF